MVTEAKIKEIFDSVQGEGTIVGYKQLFIRFCGCNLNCKYCDTDFSTDKSLKYTPHELKNKIVSEYNLSKIHSISLTGGEPLLHSDFLADFLEEIKPLGVKIYLETNATLTDELTQIKDFIDIIAADIKLPSSTGKNTFELHKKFLKNCKNIETFAKIVFDENITDEEIKHCADIAKDTEIEIILQPKMNGLNSTVSSDFCLKVMDKFLDNYKNVRLIPQTHKFLDIR